MSVIPVSLPSLAADDFTTNDERLSGLVEAAHGIAAEKWTVIYTSKVAGRTVRLTLYWETWTLVSYLRSHSSPSVNSLPTTRDLGATLRLTTGRFSKSTGS